MSGLKDREVKGFVPTYLGFLMDKINKIYNAWDEGDTELALRRACRLYYFLVDELKDKLRDDMQSISKEMNQAYNVRGPDWFVTQQNRNKQARRVASVRLPAFIDKMMTLFDERDYFEVHKKAIQEGRELGY